MNRMAATILNFFMNAILNCFRCCKHLNYATFLKDLFVILSCTAVARYESRFNFLCIYFWTNHLLASNRTSVFFFMVFVLLFNVLTSSA